MEAVIKALETAINIRRAELQNLEEHLQRFRTMQTRGRIGVIASPKLITGAFKGIDVGAAVRQFMESKRVSTLDEIREVLDKGGIEWGKYPKRQVALAISNRPDLYTKNGDVVSLNI